MGSRTNLYYERLLAAQLTVAEHRLALALGREVLGYWTTSRDVGTRRLRELAGLDGRTLDRARAGLVDKGLIHYIPGRVGRGNRSLYELLLEMPAPERSIDRAEKTAPERTKAGSGKDRSQSTKKTAPQRSRIGSKGKNTAPRQQTTDLHRRAFDAYLGAGGTLLARERGALATGVTACLGAGLDERTILAASRELGAKRDFPGHLKQRAQALADDGGPCEWDGLDRARLTAAQLGECGCQRCEQYAAYLTPEAAR